MQSLSTYKLYPYGMLMPNRHEQENTYEYGFNGMRKDDEIKDESGTSYDFGARILDPRIGRWLSRDPHESKYPNQSGYTFSLNSPLMFNDPNGKDAVVTITKDGDKTIVTYTTTVYLTGEGVTDEYMNQLNHYASSAFADRETTIDGKPYILKIDVNFVNAEKLKNDPSQVPPIVSHYIENDYNDGMRIDSQNKGEPNGLKKGDNVVLTKQDNSMSVAGIHASQAWIKSHPSKSYELFPGYTTNISSEQREAYATVHEVFHLLGLSDRVVTNPDGTMGNQTGFETDWMSMFSPMKADMTVTLSTQHVDNMIKAALFITSKENINKNTVDYGKRTERVTIYNSQNDVKNLDTKVDPNVPANPELHPK